MRGEQVILESDRSHTDIVQALRERVQTRTLFLQVFSKKDFAGTVKDDGSFDIRVVHRMRRSGFSPHLLGRMMPGMRGTRIEARFDYGRNDNIARWLMAPLFTGLALLFLLDPQRDAMMWPAPLLILAIAWLVPMFNYWWFRDDEEKLRRFLEGVTGGIAAPAAVVPR